MATNVVIIRESTHDVIHEQVRSIIKYQLFSEDYLCQRFGLSVNSIVRISRVDGELEYPPGATVPFTMVDAKKMWTLRVGCRYHLLAKDDVDPPNAVQRVDVKGKVPVEVVVLSDDSDDDEDHRILDTGSGSSSLCGSPKQDDEKGSEIKKVGLDPEVGNGALPIVKDFSSGPLKMYRISALESILAVKGHNEIFRFVKRGTFCTRQVECLPSSYDGDIIFELPPIPDEKKKGERVCSMERAKDCYYWTRIVPTSAQVPEKDIWQFGKMMCTGSLECRNDNCDFFDRGGSRNSTAWSGSYKMSTQHRVNELVEEGGLTCGFCDERPYCISSCPATMFYMYAAMSLPEGMSREHMSRLSIHQGDHVHLPRRVFSRESLDKMGVLISKHHSLNPSATPSWIRNSAIGELIAQFHPESAIGLTNEDEKEMWESLQVISTPQKFTSLLRSVRKDGTDWKGNGIFDALRKMQDNIVFPYIQRYRVPGQGSKVDFPFIFKMSVKGQGSGVDILKRMRPGEDLDGTWVMFDVMRRISTGWLTFSAHVYDHNYRALCTIFTCELMAENAASCEIAWQQMINVARQHGVTKVHIHGFMADNAMGGWNAVRNVFFGGVRDLDRERSDAFHWAQSLHKHTKEGIVEGSRAQHLILWKRLRDAKNVCEAYRIAQEITTWWKDGNCYPEKLKFLQGWLAWWVIRWRQWGNSIRLNLDMDESARMLNATGAESVHASMRKSSSQKMVGLIEACEMDQNRGAGQVASFTSYRNGGNRGKGPTLFELAFRFADAGFKSLFPENVHPSPLARIIPPALAIRNI